MPYTKTVWVNGSTPALEATNLNKIEQGIADSFRIDGTTTMTGQIVTVAGSATTPAIAPTGDSNNGIFFPALDTIAFGTAGSERVRVTSAGNVGIGTTSPADKLHVEGNIYLGTTSKTIYTGSTGDLTIQSGTGKVNIATNNGTTVFSATAAGNVGIGTTSPSAKLELSDGTITLQHDLVAGGGYVGTKSNHPLVLFTNNTEKMRLTTAGNVGIGDTNPSYKLSILGTSASTASTLRIQGTFTSTLLLGQNASGGVIRGQGGSDALSFWTGGDDATAASGSGTERMRITSTGNVGIGTSTVSSVFGTTTRIFGSSGATLQLAATNVNSYLYVSDGNGWAALAVSSNHPLVFSTNDIERMRISTAGYLLVGYTSSNGAYPLQVNGQIFATSSTIATSDQRYKENVTPLTGALDLVNALNPVQFDWKEHPVHNFNTEQPTVGFLAQEVAEVLKDKPYLNSVVKKSECTWETETGEFVDKEVQTQIENEDGTTDTVIEIIQEAVKENHTEEFYGIAESNLIAILTKAVQELSAKVTALEAKLNG